MQEYVNIYTGEVVKASSVYDAMALMCENDYKAIILLSDYLENY